MICKFCSDNGCIACPQTEPGPQMPEPIFTARLDNEHDMKLLKQFFGRESMESRVIPGIYGSEFRSVGQEIEVRGAVASLLQALHDEQAE